MTKKYNMKKSSNKKRYGVLILLISSFWMGLLPITLNGLIIHEASPLQDFNQEVPTIKTSLPSDATDFDYYKVISIDHNKVYGTVNLVNFPILLSISDSDLSDHCQGDGDDIAFAQGDIWLAHEIESYSSGNLLVWVEVLLLSPLVDTEISMYFGDSEMGSQQNQAGTWNLDYSGVYHFSESNPSGNIEDSAGINDDVTNNMESDDDENSKIGRGFDFDYSTLLGILLLDDDNIEFPNTVWSAGDISVSFWMKAKRTKNMVPMCKFSYSDREAGGWKLALESDGDINFQVGNDGNHASITSNGHYSSNVLLLQILFSTQNLS